MGEKWDYGYGGELVVNPADPTVIIHYRQAGMPEWDSLGRTTVKNVVYAGSLTDLIERMDRK